MKSATYRGLDGRDFIVEYDPSAPCVSCGQPVISASMAGTAICSWCDCGRYRDGSVWAIEDVLSPERRKAKARAIEEYVKP